ncbi:hypothetical protein V2J09_013231 [Rumex salicifolius]
MEKETGAKIMIRADTQESLDGAAEMIEKLLQPVDEVLNEHKRQQLRELATLNGTIRDEEYCRLCGEPGHRQYACPSRHSTFKSDVLCKICGDGGHPTIDCLVKGTTGKKMDDEYQNFLAELGGTVPDSLTKTTSSTPAALGSGSSATNPPWQSDGNTDNGHPGLGANGFKPKEYDETNLYIGYLPPTLEDESLIQMFSPFGQIVMAKVIKDRPVSANVYGSGASSMLSAPMPPYPMPPYPMYYGVAPPPPPPPPPASSTSDQPPSFANVPWASNPSGPPPPSEEKTRRKLSVWGVGAGYGSMMAEGGGVAGSVSGGATARSGGQQG